MKHPLVCCLSTSAVNIAKSTTTLRVINGTWAMQIHSMELSSTTRKLHSTASLNLMKVTTSDLESIGK